MVGLVNLLPTCDRKLQFSTADWSPKRGRFVMQHWPLAKLATWPLTWGSLY